MSIIFDFRPGFLSNTIRIAVPLNSIASITDNPHRVGSIIYLKPGVKYKLTDEDLDYISTEEELGAIVQRINIISSVVI